jgi:hypothetical protein
MAHDSADNNSHNKPFSSFPQYDPSLYADSRAYRAPSPPQPPSNSNINNAPNSPSMMNSTAKPQQYYQRSTDQPITDAVNNAFDHSQAAHQLPPNLIAKVTEEVIARLRAEMAQQQPQPTSPPMNSRPNVIVPPPPPHAAASATSPQSPTRKTYKSASVSDSADGHSSEGETFRPPPASAPRDIPVRQNAAPGAGARVGDSKARQGSGTERPTAERYMTSEGETIVEKMWKPLFDNGIPTDRLGQFLRGVALYLVSFQYKFVDTKAN